MPDTYCAPLALLVGLAPFAVAQQPAAPVVYTTAQADWGRQVYADQCASCHGILLNDGQASALEGEAFRRKWSRPEVTLYDLVDLTRRTMPKNDGNTLPVDDYLAVVAYVLERNGYPSGDRPLTPDRGALSGVRLATASGAAPKRAAPVFVRGRDTIEPRTAVPVQSTLDRADTRADAWLTHTQSYAGTRHSPAAQITPANAARLTVACAYQAGEAGNFQTGPVVYDGVLYLTTINTTAAIDAATCRLKWRHTWQMQAEYAGFANNRGVALKDGRVFRGTSDGYLLALDAATGDFLWARQAADASIGETFTMAPLAWQDLVFIGPAISENAIKGWIGAFRADNGAPVWRFNIVPLPGEPGYETWTFPKEFPVGGGGVWTPLALDPAKGVLFVAATNPAPDLALEVRGGTNLYTNSLIALDARTGKLSWYDQLVPNDEHDWDLTQVSPLFRATVKGKERNLVAAAGKDGILHLLDRDSHERLWATPITTRENVDLPVTSKGVRACPGILGGVEWNGPAYNPGTNLLYVPAVDWCGTFAEADTIRFDPGSGHLGGTFNFDPTPGTGWLTAVDAATGQVKWRYHSPRPMIGAITSTGGGVVFAGEVTGDVVAFEASTGKELYRFHTGGPIGGGVVTYMVGGTQYVAVASGRPSVFWVEENPGSPTLFVFKLGSQQ